MSISSYLALIIIVIVINALKSAQKKKEAEEALPDADREGAAAEAVRAEGAQSADCADTHADARSCAHDRPCRAAEGA